MNELHFWVGLSVPYEEMQASSDSILSSQQRYSKLLHCSKMVGKRCMMEFGSEESCLCLSFPPYKHTGFLISGLENWSFFPVLICSLPLNVSQEATGRKTYLWNVSKKNKTWTDICFPTNIQRRLNTGGKNPQYRKIQIKPPKQSSGFFIYHRIKTVKARDIQTK